MKPTVPVFFGIGGAVPGLDAVYALVREHPSLSIPETETHFFSSDRLNKGKEWYEAQFASCDTECTIGELASTYLHTPGVAPRIAREYPRAKLFAVIRNPVICIQHLYSEAINGKAKPPTLEMFLEQQPKLLEYFRFGRHLASYYSYYSPVDLLVLTHEDFVADPLASVKAIYTHLEINPSFAPKELRVEGEPKHPKLMGIARRLGMVKVYQYIQKLRKAHHDHLLAPKAPLANISEREYALLCKYYEKDVAQLSSLLHRDMVTEWNLQVVPEKTGKKTRGK